MLLWQPIVQRRWQQQSLVQIVGTKALSHGRILSRNTRWKTCYVWYPCSSRIYFRQTPRRFEFRPSDGQSGNCVSTQLGVCSVTCPLGLGHPLRGTHKKITGRVEQE